jgi:hypothetical protein
MAGELRANVLTTVKGDGPEKLAKQLDGLGGSIKNIGSIAGKAATGVAALASALVSSKFIGSSIEGAKSLERSMLGLDSVFGEVSPRLQQFAKDAEAFGLSQAQAAKGSVFLGSVLQQYGIGAEQAADETEKLIKLAADLATVYDYDVQEALLAITALFRGEYDPIEKFGVAMKQNEINAIRNARGLGHLTGAAEMHADALIRLELLDQRTEKAQGAVERGANTLAVSQQKLTATFENLQAELGGQLIPVLADLFDKLRPIIEEAGPAMIVIFEFLADVMSNLIDIFTDFFDSSTDIGESVLELRIQIESLIETMFGVRDTAEAWSSVNGFIAFLIDLVKNIIREFEKLVIVTQVVGQQFDAWLSLDFDKLFKTDWSGLISSTIAAGDAAKAARLEFEKLLPAARASLDPKNAGDQTEIWDALARGANGAGVIAGNKFGDGVDEGARRKAGKVALDFWQRLSAEIEKQVARGELGNLGLSEGLIDSILGSADWEKTFDRIISGGQKAADKLQGMFNQTAAGIAELEAAAERFANVDLKTDGQKSFKKFFDEIDEEIEKQTAKLELSGLGLSEGLIDQILRSDDWKGVFDTILAGGDAMAQGLQEAFNLTGAGIEEIANNAKNVVDDFYAGLESEVEKQNARGRLQGLGLSEGLIDQILGSADWEEIFDSIVKGGKEAADAMQGLFNKTAAGIDEVNRASAQAEKAAFDAAERREKMIQDIVKQKFDAAMKSFEKYKKLLEDFTATAVNAFDAFRSVLFPEAQFGRFEAGVVSLEKSLLSLLETQTELFSEQNRRILENYVAETTRLMRAFAFVRDEINAELDREQRKLEEQVSGRKSMFATVFERIIGAADVSRFKGGASSIIRQLRRTVDQAINFEGQLNQLRALGLTDRAISQIEAAGVEGGAATARALLRGGASAVEEINSLYDKLGAVAEAQAERQSSELFDSGIALSQGLIEGLLSQADQMKMAAEVMAAVFEETFNRSVDSAAIRFLEPNQSLIEARTRAWFDWLDSLPALAAGEQRMIRGGTVVSGPGTGMTMPDFGSGPDYSKPVSGTTQIVINVTASDRLSGAAAGEEIIKLLKQWELANGPISSVLR